MNWPIFFLMLPHLKPKCIGYFFPTFYRVLDGVRVLSLLVIVGLYLYRIYKAVRLRGEGEKLPALLLKDGILPSPPVLVLGALEAWICLAALLKGGDYVENFSVAVSVIGIVLLVDFYSDRMEELLTSLMLNYEWVVYVNLFTVLRWPDRGLTRDPQFNDAIFFFGPANWFMYLCIPAVCVALLYLRMQLARGRRIDGIMRAVYLITASYACVILEWSVTAILAMTVITTIALVSLIPGVRKCVFLPLVFACGIAANLAITVFRVMETVPWISGFIQTVLKKGVTISGRTTIWDGFWELIQGNLLTGIAKEPEGYFIAGRYFDHIHNQYLDLLALGGVPALLLFLAALILVGRKLTIHRKTPSARLMTAVMAGLLVMCIPEVCRHGSIFLLFPLAYHAQKLEDACRLKLPPEAGTAA